MGRAALWFWLGAAALLAGAIWLFSGILLPFVAGCAIAYFLDPAVDRLERMHVPRGAGSALVLSLFFAGVVLVLMLLVPVIELEAAELVRLAPQAFDAMRHQIETMFALAQQRLSPDDLARVRESMAGLATDAVSLLALVVQRLLTSGLALANLVSLIVITPVVSFFLLRDWDQLISVVDSWLPRRHAETIRTELRVIDATLAGFVHGQFLVGCILAVYYGIALSLAGLNFAVILALTIGLLAFIPVIGIITALVLSVGLGLIQFGLTAKFAVILSIFAVGYAIDSSFVSPRFVGKRVNLHPVWVIFAFFAFGSVFGLIGVLLAVPAAAVIGVLLRFAVAQYLASPLYDPDR